MPLPSFQKLCGYLAIFPPWYFQLFSDRWTTQKIRNFGKFLTFFWSMNDSKNTIFWKILFFIDTLPELYTTFIKNINFYCTSTAYLFILQLFSNFDISLPIQTVNPPWLRSWHWNVVHSIDRFTYISIHHYRSTTTSYSLCFPG